MSACCPRYLYPCLVGNIEQVYTEGDYSATIPADTVFTPNSSSSNCIALELARDEVLEEICESVLPIADPQELATDPEIPIEITLTGSTPVGDFLFFEITNQPDHGTLVGSGDSYTYTPGPTFQGVDSFEFTVNNGTNTSIPALVTIFVGDISGLGCIPYTDCELAGIDCAVCDQSTGEETQYIVNGFLSTLLTVECPS